MGTLDNNNESNAGLENLSRDLQSSFKKNLRDYAETLFFIFLLAVLLRVFFFASYKVASDDLYPSLQHGDYVIGFKPAAGVPLPFTNAKLGSSKIRPGDFVAYKCGEDKASRCVRRLIGLPGDRIEVIDFQLFRNEAIMVKSIPSGVSVATGVVPPGKAFILGSSKMIDVSDFEALPLFIWFSRRYDSQLQNFSIQWGRIGHWLD